MSKKFDLEAYKRSLDCALTVPVRVGFIYMITNLLNGKKYIGQTTRDPETRWKEHCIPVKNGRFNKSLIRRAITAHGAGSFKYEVVAMVPVKALNNVEFNFIRHYKTLAPSGYNCVSISETYCWEISKVTRLKMSEARKGKSPWNKGKKGKQKAWNKGKHNYSGCKPIYSVCIKTGQVKHYKSAADAVREGFNSGHVTQCCKGKLKHHKGRYWHYNKESDSE
jgi:hypothetical protein